jgi:O-antigen biosynthesis protein
MYLCHFTVFTTEMVREQGGFRSEMDGAQDFDLALRLLPQLTNVVHIPRPLYHWRSWSESTAQSIDAKPWAQQAGARAQQSYIDREFGGGSVAPSAVKGLNEVHPKIKNSVKVSVIIPTIGTKSKKSGTAMVNEAIATLRAQETNTDFEVIVVTTGELAPIPGADHQVVYSTNSFNFAEAINLGRTAAHGEYLLILNDDTTAIEPQPITRLLEIGQNQQVGIVGAKLTYPDGRLQHVGMIMLPSGPTHPWIAKSGNEYGYFGATLTPRNYSAVTAAAALVRAELFDQMGGFDTLFARDFNDVDFCLRMRDRGYRVAWTPYAHFTHHEGASIVRKKSDPRELALFQERWAAKYAVDPYYSPALKPDIERLYEAR